jgi:hypothetical protein
VFSGCPETSWECNEGGITLSETCHEGLIVFLFII